MRIQIRLVAVLYVYPDGGEDADYGAVEADGDGEVYEEVAGEMGF